MTKNRGCGKKGGNKRQLHVCGKGEEEEEEEEEEEGC